jgi:hypothetical protein
LLAGLETIFSNGNLSSAGLQGYARAGATHLVLRFGGDHERHLEEISFYDTSVIVENDRQQGA